MLSSGILELVPADPALAGAAADFHRRNRDFFAPYNPIREDAYFTEDYQRRLLQQEAEEWKQKRSFRFYLRLCSQPDRIIGLIGLNQVVWGAFLSCYLGYMLDEGCVNRGYMTMAVKLAVEFAFGQLGLHRIEANVMPRNLPSRRVLEKCGFENEGLSKAYLNIHGVWEDHIHMVRLNERL